MHSVSFLLPAFLLLLSPLLQTVAWGPITHQMFAFDFVSSGSSEWIKTVDPDSLYTGSDAPDAFFFGRFQSGSQCPESAASLHSPILAGYLIQAANASGNDTLKSFALGFASHIIGDAIGFAANGGYLGTHSKLINWLTGFMLAVDAFVVQQNLFPPATYPSDPISADNLAFFAQVVEQYATINPQSPSLNASELELCTSIWAPAVVEFNKMSFAQDADTTEQQLVFFDQFNTTDLAEAVADLQASFSCVQPAIAFYMSAVLAPNATPEAAFEQTGLMVADAFAAGKCTVQRARQQRRLTRRKLLH